MILSPLEEASGLQIGVVETVSADEIEIALDIEAPESLATSVGTPRPFPRINDYLLLPLDADLLVGQIGRMTVKRSAFPKRRGMRDFGLVDLPFPLRRISLNPLGTLEHRNAADTYRFKRGTNALPPVGTPVVLPTALQLRSIVGSEEKSSVRIGSSPFAGDADVFVDPDRLFGRHLAVLGNTGSGKSCTVAGLIRWSLERAQSQRRRARRTDSDVGEGSTLNPNARVIVLDPNGEYSRAFSDSSGPLRARVFSVRPTEATARLRIPLWLWTSAEWSSFTYASPRTQQPLLRRALREVKSGRQPHAHRTSQERQLALRRYLSSRLLSIREDLNRGGIQDDASAFGFRLKATLDDLEGRTSEFPQPELAQNLAAALTSALDERHHSFVKNRETIEYYRAFTEREVSEIVSALEACLESLGGLVLYEGPGEDVPLQFKGTDLADHLDMLALESNVNQYVEYLTARIRSLLAEPLTRKTIDEATELDLADWLSSYIGDEGAGAGCVTVVDLSFVPASLVHLTTAVLARVVFEALQIHLELKESVLPTVLVIDEAHTFVRRYREDPERTEAAVLCCQSFERIAREGRKFGLGLVLASQRPSELSPTVLSQCNSFLLHRISNDRDQERVHRLVPDSLRGLLRELPSLPSQVAILLGWASELPLLVRIRDLPRAQRPKSDDPDFWRVWTGQEERPVDWNAVAEHWQSGNAGEPLGDDSGSNGCSGLEREADSAPDPSDDDDFPF